MKKTMPLLVVCGPTASGKTGLAIDLALSFGGEIVSADSMQIYRDMNIGTAKPTPEEMRGIPHHLLDFLAPGERFSVAQYVEKAKEAVADIAARGRLPILCGGTGLYIDSLTRNVQFAEIREDLPLRQELRELAAEQGNDAVWRLLEGCDPSLAAKLHPNNLGRVIRGIEVHRVTGIPLSEWQRRSLLVPPEYDLCMLGLDYRSRAALYDRIDRRVELMLRQGLREEARVLYDAGLAGTAGQAIGYKEFFACFRGEQSTEEAVDTLKRETRRYAKRQLTWFRRDGRIRWLYPDDYENADALLGAARAIVEENYGKAD